MRDTYQSLKGDSAAPAPQGARLHSQARETFGAVAEIGARLERLLGRLRGETPTPVDSGEKQSRPPAFDTLLDSIHHGAVRAHEMLGEIEGLI